MKSGGVVPKLRFPEFQNTREWEVTTIGDLKPFVTSGSRGWAPFYAEQGELFVRITNLWRDFIYLDLTDSKFVQLPPEANEGIRTQLKKHDVLISITADIGIIGYVDESVPSPAYINQHIALVRFDEAQLCSKYVAYFLASERSQRLFRASTDTGTKAGMNLIGIQKIELMLPGLPEQQKIAECLSSVDELIAAQARKVDALKTHKKGLMQQLFPREGETVPRLRFPEFRGAGEWEVKRLKHLATYTKGFAFKSQDYREEGIRIIRVSDLGADFIKSDNEKIFIDVKSAWLHERYRLRNEEIIITTVGSKPELIDSAVGRGIRVTQPDEGLLNQNLLKLEVLPGTSSMFLFCNINTELYQKFIVSISRGNANQANIAVKELMDFEVTVPAFLEQQRIASCLSSLDALITAETQKLEALKTHKKGLMQQLFPSPQEVES